MLLTRTSRESLPSSLQGMGPKTCAGTVMKPYLGTGLDAPVVGFGLHTCRSEVITSLFVLITVTCTVLQACLTVGLVDITSGHKQLGSVKIGLSLVFPQSVGNMSLRQESTPGCIFLRLVQLPLSWMQTPKQIAKRSYISLDAPACHFSSG